MRQPGQAEAGATSGPEGRMESRFLRPGRRTPLVGGFRVMGVEGMFGAAEP